MADLICQCGCSQVIPPSPWHRYKPPKYIQSHYLKMGTHLRIEKLREAKRLQRLQPPEDWSKPTGLCECGCGKPTKVAKASRPKFEEYAGYPQRFVWGHHQRLRWGSRSPLFKGGRRYTKDGYVMMLIRHGPYANRRYIPEHRLIYERSRRTILSPQTHVHHINGIRDDNRPENLIAVTRGVHKRVHLAAQSIASLFLDAALYEQARQHFLQHHEVPDLAALTQGINYQP